MKNNTAVLSVRVNESNPDHHIFSNNGTWWLHATVHNPDFTKQRVRLSLKTRDVAVARERRDEWLARRGIATGVVRPGAAHDRAIATVKAASDKYPLAA